MISDQFTAKIMRRLYAIRGFGYLPIVENNRRKGVKAIEPYPKAERYATINDFWGNLKFRVDRATYMGSNIYWKGYHQKAEIVFLKSTLQPSMVVVDMGANQGEFTVILAAAVPQGTVIAFEPLADIRADLEYNIALNQFSNVLVFPCGVSDKAGELPIFTSEDTTRQQSLHEGLGTLYQTDYRSKQIGIIPLRRFDDVIKEINVSRIDIIKIDIEGAELYALKGALDSIKTYQPKYILVELSKENSGAAGYEVREILDLLANVGYRWHKLSKHGKLENATFDEIQMSAVAGIDAVAVFHGTTNTKS
jgi:FkbM family methyltransferase